MRPRDRYSAFWIVENTNLKTDKRFILCGTRSLGPNEGAATEITPYTTFDRCFEVMALGGITKIHE